MTVRRELAPDVRARTILAGCASARLTPHGDVPADVGCDGNLGVVVDRAGSAYLVVASDARTPAGRFRLTCRAGVPGLGVLRLDGRCGEAVCPIARADIGELVERHLPHVSPQEVTVFAVEVEAVTVLTPATDACRACAVPVALDAYSSARPDAWVLAIEAIREGLEREQQDDLRRLAAEALAVAGEPLTVSVTGISAHRLDLACLSIDGVTPVTLRFGTPLEHPDQVPDWVAQAVGRPWHA